MNFEEDSSDGGRYAFAHDKYVASEGEGRLARLEKLNGNLLLLFFFALVVILDATVQEAELAEAAGEDVSINSSGALGVAIASIFITLVRYAHSCCVEEELSPGFQMGIAVAVVLIWTLGVYFLTFLDNGTFATIISSGFFAVWACLLISVAYLMSSCAAASDEGGCDIAGTCCCGLDLRKGLTGNLGVTIILCIAVIISASSETNSLGGNIAMIFSIIMLIPLTTMICIPYGKYTNPDRFTFIMSVLIVMSFLIILASTTNGPFVERKVDEEPLFVNGNGYFAVIGLFIALVVMFWNSHLFMLYQNRDEGGDFGIQGRYIWSSLLGGTGIVVMAAGATECVHFEAGCDESDFLLGAVVLGLSTAGLVVLLYLVGKENIDNGDDQILSPGSGFDFFDNNFQRLEFLGALILQIAWAVAAFTFTFVAKSPFNSAANGYFFAWFGFFFASQYFSAIYPKFSLTRLSCLEWDPPNGMERRNNFGLGIGAAGVLIQFIDVTVTAGRKLIDGDDLVVEEFAAIGCQVFTLISILLLVFIRPERLGGGAVLLNYLFIIAAYVQLVITTIILNPFEGNEGNGFFAAWVIMYGSIYNLNHYEWKVDNEY